GFEGIAGAVVLLEKALAALEIDVESEVPLQLLPDAWLRLDDRQLEDALRVVGHGTIRVDRDGDGSHAEEPERHEAEREYRRREHQLRKARGGNAVTDRHQRRDGDAHPERAEIPGDESGKHVE